MQRTVDVEINVATFVPEAVCGTVPARMQVRNSPEAPDPGSRICLLPPILQHTISINIKPAWLSVMRVRGVTGQA